MGYNNESFYSGSNYGTASKGEHSVSYWTATIGLSCCSEISFAIQLQDRRDAELRAKREEEEQRKRREEKRRQQQEEQKRREEEELFRRKQVGRSWCFLNFHS